MLKYDGLDWDGMTAARTFDIPYVMFSPEAVPPEQFVDLPQEEQDRLRGAQRNLDALCRD